MRARAVSDEDQIFVHHRSVDKKAYTSVCVANG